MFIALTRLPKANEFLRAVDNLNEKMVSLDNLASLLKNWPSEEMEELMTEANAAGPDAEWETTEAFFITLGSKKKFETRLKLWQFKLTFENQVNILLEQ